MYTCVYIYMYIYICTSILECTRLEYFTTDDRSYELKLPETPGDGHGL